MPTLPGKIKCSYDDCFKRFASIEAMKKHKAKDSAHDFYCKKCDLDCKDDIELLYHQITSQRHVACPICGTEFQSESGRDRHVGVNHIPKQSIDCPGCQLKFDRASTLMAHIEHNECEVIRGQDFQRKKAEDQVTQDARNAALEPTAGATILSNARSYAEANNEKNLLDDDRAFVSTDWQGRPHYDEDIEHNGPYVDPPNDMMSTLSISKFPPLGPHNRDRTPSPPRPIVDPAPGSTDWTEETQPPPIPEIIHAWSTNTNSASYLFKPTSKPKPSSPPPNTSTPSINLLDSFEDDDLTPRNPESTLSSLSNIPQPSTLPPLSQTNTHNNTTTDPNAHIKTRPPSLSQIPNLHAQAFHDSVLNKFVCPTQTCGRHFDTPTAFHAHLLHPPHAGSKVTCPSCYKKFKSATALLSHCESGSRRCGVRNALDYDRVVRSITAGIMAVEGTTEEGAVRYVAKRVEEW